jgi:hypothetical protein
MVELRSAAMLFNVCRYLSWSAIGDSLMTLAASLSAHDAFCSPSAATTLARASRVASASVAIDRCNCTGNRTSLLFIRVVCGLYGMKKFN